MAGSGVSSQLRGLGRKSEFEAARGWFALREAQSCTGDGTHRTPCGFLAKEILIVTNHS